MARLRLLLRVDPRMRPSPHDGWGRPRTRVPADPATPTNDHQGPMPAISTKVQEALRSNQKESPHAPGTKFSVA